MQAMLEKQRRRKPRKHKMPTASKTMAGRLMALRKESDLEYSFLSENARYESRYDYQKEIGHDY
jgi:hypothetical protein